MHLQREAIRAAYATALGKPDGQRNPGLLFARALPEWPSDATKRGEAFAKFLQQLAQHPAPEGYRQAYERWQRLHANPLHAACWEGQLDTRLFTGLGGPHALETCLSFSRPWGLPLLPGSVLKGLTRAHALHRGVTREAAEVLFGRAPDGDGDDGESGCLIFHDAWWKPGSAPTPLAPEVVTVHHADYYGSGGETPATDFDSPNPNAQIAARGGFLFVIEGEGNWAQYAMNLLREALTWRGVGGKTAAGYGYFGMGQLLAAVTAKSDEKPIAPSTETWKAALIDWQGGSRKLTARDDASGRTASVSGDTAKALWESLSKGQRNRKPLRLDVRVEVFNNQATIQGWAPAAS